MHSKVDIDVCICAHAGPQAIYDSLGQYRQRLLQCVFRRDVVRKIECSREEEERGGDLLVEMKVQPLAKQEAGGDSTRGEHQVRRGEGKSKKEERRGQGSADGRE